MGVAISKHILEDGDRVLVAGRPDYNRCDNMITTYKYTVWTFLPIVRNLLYCIALYCVANVTGVIFSHHNREQ